MYQWFQCGWELWGYFDDKSDTLSKWKCSLGASSHLQIIMPDECGILSVWWTGNDFILFLVDWSDFNQNFPNRHKNSRKINHVFNNGTYTSKFFEILKIRPLKIRNAKFPIHQTGVYSEVRKLDIRWVWSRFETYVARTVRCWWPRCDW